MDDATSARSIPPSSSPRRAPCRASSGAAPRWGPGHGAVLLALCRPGLATIGTRRRPAARSTRTIQPRSDVPWQQLGIELIPAYSPEARGRSERMFGTLQKRLPQELEARRHHRYGRAANRFLKEDFLPATQCPLRDRPAEDTGLRLRAVRRQRSADILCACRRTVWSANDNTVRYKNLSTADPGRPPSPPLRQGQSECARISRRRQLPSSMARAAWPATKKDRTTDRKQRNPRGRVIRFDATGRRPVDKWTAAPRPTTSPQGQKPQQKRSTHMVHKPVNSECSRHN